MTLKIEVLTTPDCSSCSRLEEMLDKMGVSYDIIDVTQKPEYLEKYPIYTAPGLVVNDKLVYTGIPKKEELESLIKK
ncbi:MAG: thioredoxin family protein [Crenarchaeota archaeon]|nr:MAG: thioredoxin family protein [Thermoproteota archaeon]RDJ33987.1 MAG: thioredoxin family protein [Thermoproteota archaeon]RDJ36898.1 MAG: thioredoxin family protein [Thermoproteota archaeon]RDJ37567.1 MAG: thioredoxin family protein [Thermoproteota archaeon]